MQRRLLGMSVFALAAALLAAWPLGAVETQFTFAVIGDRTGSAVEGEYERILAEVAQLGPDLIITVGDHIQGYTSDSTAIEQQWDEFVGLMEETGIQYYLTPGNHDIWDRQSAAIFKRRFGGPDRYFRFKGKVFVILDVATYNQAGALPQEKIEWLKRVLEVSKSAGDIFVFYHKPFWCEDFSAGRENVLHEIFRSYPVRAVFTGHYHRYFYTVRDSIEYFGVSSSGASLPSGGRERGAFYSYMLGRVKGDDLSVRLLEPGIFTPVDIVTYEDAIAMAEAEARSVRVSELLAYDFRMSGTGQVTVSVENRTDTILRDRVAWVLRGDWAVQPMQDYIEVPPGETGTLTASVRCDGWLFPVPILEMHVPCCDGKQVEVVRPLNVRRVIYADYADNPPAIDGILDESVWLSHRGEGRFFGPQGGRAASDSTMLRICYDSSDVYVGIDCFDRDTSSLAATVAERDGFAAEDDAVTLLLEPLSEAGIFYQISVNPIGTIFDRSIEICPFGTYVVDPAWDPPIRAQAVISRDRWTVELAIPIAALSLAGLGARGWGFNFSRIQQRLGTSANFQAPFRYKSDDIGLLGFR